MSIERNKHYIKTRTNEYGQHERVRTRFYKHRDCLAAYKSLFCWANFPRCDITKELTLPLCRSACENFFKACHYKPDLYRCGPSKYFNGQGPETPGINKTTGAIVYLRDFFPGQPWEENHITPGGGELPICTPAVVGSGHHITISTYLVFLLHICIFIFYIVY